MSMQVQNAIAAAAAANQELSILLTVIYDAQRVYKTHSYQIGNGPIKAFPNRHDECTPEAMGQIASSVGYTVYEGPWRRFGTYQHGWKFRPITATMPEKAMPADQVEDEALTRRMERAFKLNDPTARIVNRKDGVHPKAIYVGRPTHFGNPFTHLNNVKGAIRVDSIADAIEDHRQYLAGEVEIPELNEKRINMIGELLTLRNRQLECWCEPEPCHASTLAEWADTRPPIRILVTTSTGIAAKLEIVLASKPGAEIEILPIMPSGMKEQASETTAWAARKGCYQTPIWLPAGNPSMVYEWTANTLAPYATHVIADTGDLGNALSKMAYHTSKPYRNY